MEPMKAGPAGATAEGDAGTIRPQMPGAGSPTAKPRTHTQAVGPIGQAYRMLRTGLDLGKDGAAPQVIAVTSATRGEGKTTTSLGLSMASVVTGRWTVLLEGDLYRPTLSDVLPIPSDAPTIVDALRYPDTDITPARIDGLDILPAPRGLENPARLLQPPLVLKLLSRLRMHYNDIIIDTPPVTATSDALTLARYADGVVVVMDAESPNRQAHRMLRKVLHQAGINVLGVALNRGDLVEGSDYYGYGYGSESASTR